MGEQRREERRGGERGKYLEVVALVYEFLSLEDVAHHQKANLPSAVGLHTVQPEELRQQGVLISSDVL